MLGGNSSPSNTLSSAASTPRAVTPEFFIDDLLVQIHFIIVMIRWTGLAPWEFEFPFPGSRISTVLGKGRTLSSAASTPRAVTPACSRRNVSNPSSSWGGGVENNYFTEIYCGSEAGSYLRLRLCVSLNSRLASNNKEEEEEEEEGHSRSQSVVVHTRFGCRVWG